MTTSLSPMYERVDITDVQTGDVITAESWGCDLLVTEKAFDEMSCVCQEHGTQYRVDLYALARMGVTTVFRRFVIPDEPGS